MDIEWAIGELETFVQATTPHNGSGNGYLTTRDYSEAPRHIVLEKWAAVKQILHQAYPDWESENLVDVSYEFGQKRDAAIQCISMLRNQAELELKLGHSGPKLFASDLHPWIWEPIKSLWQTGHFRSAIQLASTHLEHQLQAKLHRRDITGKDLVDQAFSPNPPASGKPRLRVKPLANDESTKNAQEGLKNLAVATTQLIRNLRTHLTDELSEANALEELAVLSLLSRKIQDCQVIEADG